MHRPAYPDFVSLREVDATGRVVREHRFMGLYTSSVYNDSVREIPYIRRKVDEVRRRADFDSSAHLGKELAQVLEGLPRDDLFQTPVDDLFSTAMAIVQIQERSKVRVFLRRDPYGQFFYCLAYVPRDIYSTEVRQRMQQILMDRLHAPTANSGPSSPSPCWRGCSSSCASIPYSRRMSIRRAWNRNGAGLPQLEGRLRQPDGGQLRRSPGHLHPRRLSAGLPGGYRERFAPHLAVVDMRHLLALSDERRLAMGFYQPLTQTGDNILHCKLYHADTPLALSDVLPILENLGLRVLGEIPYELRHRKWPPLLDP